jgi:methionyl-tRNA formyltransferase
MHKVKIDNIAVLTSEESWFVPYAHGFVEDLRQKGYQVQLFHKHEDVGKAFEVVFILSYFLITDVQFLKSHKHNLVVHESDLPSGKGWAPLFWQILEGKNTIPVVLFEAVAGVDEGPIYLKDHIVLEGHELNDEIRRIQAAKTIEMCQRFLDDYENITAVSQNGKESLYPKRTPADSELDPEKSISSQFDLLRIVNNDDFPAFFNYRNHKYIIKIFKADESR